MGCYGGAFLMELGMSITAFVFPGQGSQSVGMLAELADKYPLIIELFPIISVTMCGAWYSMVLKPR